MGVCERDIEMKAHIRKYKARGSEIGSREVDPEKEVVVRGML